MRIIKPHNGEINVHSELGKGTTFRIYLELSESKVQRVEVAGPSVSAGESEIILVVEDRREVRRLIMIVLEKFGHAAIEATDGEEAVRKFAENRYIIQLLILDVVMP